MSALSKNTSSKSSKSKSTSSKSASREDGKAPKNAKGKTTPKAKAKFAGSLAIAAKGTPPHAPKKPKQPAKPKKKKQEVGDAQAMGKPAASSNGANVAKAPPSTSGGGQNPGKGPKSEASKAAKKVNSKKPSKLLKAYKGLGKEVTAGKKKDEGKAHEAIPDFHAVMPSDAAVDAENKAKDAKADTKVDDKVPGAEGKAPKIEKQKKGKATRQKVDGKSKGEMKRLAALENALDALKSMFGGMTSGISTDSNVNTDPGPAPEIVFSGSSNPQRAEKADKEADTKINDGHDKFAKAIDDGKQPSDVHRKEMDEVVKAVKNSDLKIGEEQLAAGEKYYEKLIKQHTGKEIDGADKIMDSDVQTQMAKANKDMDKVLDKQEQDRQDAVAQAKKDIDSENAKAKDEQEKIVDTSKKDIAKAQKDTRKKQDQEVKKAKRKGDKEKKKVEKDIADKEKKDEKKIAKEYDKAEKKAEKEEKKAEAKARKEKQKAEKKKKEQSWWDRVKSAVSDFVDSVCSAIGSIFDALGSLVSGILNAVKDLACAIIQVAVEWAKKTLDALGSLLKGLVTGLLGDIFPELAKKLNEAIDAGIDLAKKGVETVGEKLKEGVTAAVDTVNATVQKGLQVAKVGLQTAVRVTGCIATGDFEGAFLATFYGALEIAGVSKGEAEKMLGNAKETIKLIVDDFGGFAGNLITAASDGFSNFGKNFLGHFTSSVTEWLLGPVAAAGLKAPEKWDAQGIFGMVLGVLGVSTDSMKEMAAERIGEENMAALEKAYEYVMSFVEGGFAGLWEQAKSDLGNIWDLVLGMITDYITKKVVQFGMEQLASLMAGPFGALFQALKTAWGIYCTVRDKINEIKEVLSAIFSSISDIARGNTKKASAWVEGALQKVLGIAIDLGANLAGIGDIPDKIRGFVEGLQERVKTAIGKAMDWVLEKVKGLFTKGKGKDEDKEPEKTEDDGKKDNGRRAKDLKGVTLASKLGAIDISYAEPTSAGHPPILQSTGALPNPLRAKGIPDLDKKVKAAPDAKQKAGALENMKHAKGVAMGLESKGQRYIAGEDNKGDVKKAFDVLGAHLLDAADFAAIAGDKDGSDTIGKELKFSAGGEAHRMFFQVANKDAELMVASTIKSAPEHLKDFLAIINGKDFKGDAKRGKDLVAQGRSLSKKADDEAEAALDGLAPSDAMVAEEKSLVEIFTELFNMTADKSETELHDYIQNKLTGPDKDHLAALLAKRTDGAGMDLARAKKYSVVQLQSIGRGQWRELATSDTSFAKDVQKTIGDTIAARKFKEIDKEHWGPAKAKEKEFWKKLTVEYKKRTEKKNDALFNAMSAAASGFKGLGEEKPLVWKEMFRANGAGAFFRFNVTDDHKDDLADDIVAAHPHLDKKDLKKSYGDTGGPVFAQFAKEHQGKDIPKSVAKGEFRTGAWWTPDKRCVRPSSAPGKELDNFKDLCEINALAPEWYPEGFLSLTVDTSATKFVRPTVWDGMLSPLWVQESPDNWAATGGGAVEFVQAVNMGVKALKSIKNHILPADVTKAIKKLGKEGPSTNEWTEDPTKPGASGDANEKAIQDLQKKVGDDTQKARKNADEQGAEFDLVKDWPGDPGKAVKDQGSNWTKVKKKWANPAGKEFMLKILRFRQATVDSLIKEVQMDHPGIQPQAFGSKDLTSDYDVSLYGPDEHIGVAEFNKRFRKRWGAEAGTVFDSNIYTKGSYMPDVKTTKNADGSKTHDITEANPVTTGEGKDNDYKLQDVLSLIKIRKHMSEDEWDDFVDATLKKITDDATKKEARKRFDAADSQYVANLKALHEKIVKLNLADDEADKVFAAGKKSVAAKAKEIMAANPDAELQASNRLYEEMLSEVAAKASERDSWSTKINDGSPTNEEVAKLDDLTAEVKRLQGKALQFANEAYFSEGAVRHVVGNMQAGYGINLQAQQAMQSFNEQLGDAIKDIAHYTEFGKAAYRSSKYVDRLCSAGQEVARQLSSVTYPSVGVPLGKMATLLLRIRKGKAPYDTLDDAGKVTEAESIAKSHGVTSKSSLKSKVVKLGQELNSAARAELQAAQSDSPAA